MKAKKSHSLEWLLSVLALPIFPGRLQPSIVGRSELNFRVRDGNGWTLAPNQHQLLYCSFISTVTNLYSFVKFGENGDPYRIRTDVNGVKAAVLTT